MKKKLEFESEIAHTSCPCCAGDVLLQTEKDKKGKIINQWRICRDLECEYFENIICEGVE